MASRFIHFLDRFIYAGDKDSAEAQRKGRFFVVTTFLLLLLAFSGSVFVLLPGSGVDFSLLSFVANFFLLVLSISLFFIYRKWGKRVLLVNILTAAMVISNLGVYESTGGIFSPDNLWAIIMAGWVFLVADKKSGIAWFIIAVISYSIFLYASVNNWKDFRTDAMKLPDSYYFISFTLAAAFLCMIIYLHETGKEKYLVQLMAAKTETEEQKKIVEEKNKDVTDSINYAKRIQDAIFPGDDERLNLFPQSFILFMPRDIVSGDFYWYTSAGGKKFIAAADCTGHGVPGAFMSMIGSAFLNEIVNEKGILNPTEILNSLREMIIKSLRQIDQSTSQDNKPVMQDGMDISLLALNENGTGMEWAGANNPLWMMNQNGFQEITATKQPVGFTHGQLSPFTLHQKEVMRGDLFYLFTDGFADQFGGPKGKKFKYRQLQEILELNAGKEMSFQKDKLRKVFLEWKGQHEQVDDVLIIGVKN